MKKSGQISIDNLMGLAPAPSNKMTESELSNYKPQYLDEIDTSFILTPNDPEILNVLLYLGECGFSINYDKVITEENKQLVMKLLYFKQEDISAGHHKLYIESFYKNDRSVPRTVEYLYYEKNKKAVFNRKQISSILTDSLKKTSVLVLSILHRTGMNVNWTRVLTPSSSASSNSMRTKSNLDYYIDTKKRELEDINTATERDKAFIEHNKISVSNFIELLKNEGVIDKHINPIRQITINSYKSWKERTDLPEAINTIDKILKHPGYKKAYREYMQVSRLAAVAYTKTTSNSICKYVESLQTFNSSLEDIRITISDIDKHLERNAIDDECVTNLIVFLSRSIREANASLTSANRYRGLIINPPKTKFVYEDAKKSTEEDIKASTERFYGIRRYINDVTGLEIPA